MLYRVAILVCGHHGCGHRGLWPSWYRPVWQIMGYQKWQLAEVWTLVWRCCQWCVAVNEAGHHSPLLLRWICVCLCCALIADCQTFSCVRTGPTTSSPSCTTSRRGSRRTRISGRWRRESTTVRTTQSTRWTAVSATSWCSRASRHPPCRCPSSHCPVRSAMPRCHQPFTSLSSARRLQSHHTTPYHWSSRTSVTDYWLQKPSTFASFSFRFRSRSATDVITIIRVVDVV